MQITIEVERKCAPLTDADLADAIKQSLKSIRVDQVGDGVTGVYRRTDGLRWSHDVCEVKP